MDDSIPTKICGRCAIQQPVSDFHKRKAAKDGLHPHCKCCVSETSKAWYRSVHDQRLVQQAAWRNANRQASRAASKRWAVANSDRVKANMAMWRAMNAERIAEYERAYYQENADRKRAYSRQWRTAHPDHCRAANAAYRTADPLAHNQRIKDWKRKNLAAANAYDRKKKAKRRGAAGIPYTYSDLVARLSMFGHKCYVCGADGEAVDHVKPLAAGGWDCLSNLRPICTSCNSRKGRKWPYGGVCPAFRFVA